MNAPFLRPDVAVEQEDWAKSTRKCANTRKRKPNAARGRSIAWTSVTCSQELSGLAIGSARPGKLMHHHHNLKYVHPICECYTFLLSYMQFIAFEYASWPSGCTDLKSESMSWKLEWTCRTKMCVWSEDALPVEQEDALFDEWLTSLATSSWQRAQEDAPVEWVNY